MAAATAGSTERQTQSFSPVMISGLVGRTVTVTSVHEATPGHYAVVCLLEKGDGSSTGAGEQVIFWTTGAERLDAEQLVLQQQAQALQQQAQQMLGQ